MSVVQLKIVSVVDHLVVKQFWNSVKRLFCSKKVSSCEYIRCSSSFPGIGSKDIGRRSSGPFIFATLGIGTMVAVFHTLGKNTGIKNSDNHFIQQVWFL